MTKKQLASILDELAPVVVEDGGIFEAAITARGDGVSRPIIYQGEKRIADVIAYLINKAAGEQR